MALLSSSSRCQLDWTTCDSSNGHTLYSFHTFEYALPPCRDTLHSSTLLSINPLRRPLWSIHNSFWRSHSFYRTLHLLLLSHYSVTTGLFICIYSQRTINPLRIGVKSLIFEFPVTYITLGTCQDQMIFRI